MDDFFRYSFIVSSSRIEKEIDNLEERKKFLEDQIEKDNKLILDLNDTDSLEKFARETYWHKKENETIFIVE